MYSLYLKCPWARSDLTFSNIWEERVKVMQSESDTIKNMYMCGSSTHPGGGVSSACGANAAREILMDLRLDNTVPDDDFYDE